MKKRNPRYLFIFALHFSLFTFLFSFVSAQDFFPDRCAGNWKGTLLIFNEGKLKDSVALKLSIAKKDKQSWSWKTDYVSEKYPMTKNYTIKSVNPAKGMYMMDEGDGMMLNMQVFGNKAYSVFETAGIMLTSTYELTGETLIFEVSSGPKSEETGEVISHQVNNLQRAVLKRN